MNEFERKRLDAITDHRNITPVELLKQLIDDIERGHTKVDGLVILTALRPPEGSWTYETRRANMARDQELVALVMAQERCIRGWTNP